MSDHLTPTITDRGFTHLPPVPTTFAGRRSGEVRVYESSAAAGPHIWLAVEEELAGSRAIASAHLPLADAAKLRDQLTWMIDHHYQNQESST